MGKLLLGALSVLASTALGKGFFYALDRAGYPLDRWAADLIGWSPEAVGWILAGLAGFAVVNAWSLFERWRLRRRHGQRASDLYAEATVLWERIRDLQEPTEDTVNALVQEGETWTLNAKEWLRENVGDWAAAKLTDYGPYLPEPRIPYSQALNPDHNWQIHAAEYRKRRMDEIRKSFD